MTRAVGFHTWYRPQGVAYLAVRLAALAEALGCRASVLAHERYRPPVHPDWDGRVLPPTADFAAWAAGLDVVVWPEFVLLDALAAARRAGCRCVLVPMWEQLRPEHLPTLARYDDVVCTSAACYEALRPYAVRASRLIPYDVGLARRPSARRPDRVQLYYPAAGPQPRRQALAVLPVLGRLLAAHPDLHVLVSYLRDWPAESRRALAALRARWGRSGRLRVVRDQPHEAHLRAYADSDLTVWPTCREGLGLIGPESLSQGTPVLAVDLPPMNEYLPPTAARLVPARPAGRHWPGVPAGDFDAAAYAAALEGLLADRGELRRLAEGAAAAAGPEAACRAGWREVLRAGAVD